MRYPGVVPPYLPEIEVLGESEAVRRRPSMFIGDPREAGTLVCLVVEAVCLAAEQLVLGTALQATVTLAPEGVLVEDDGDGLSVEVDANGRPHAENIASVLYACRLAKAGPEFGERFCSAGIFVTNALSQFFEMDFVREGARWFQRYERGRAVAPLACVGPSAERGTRLRFRPDPELFGDARIDADVLRARLQEHDHELHGRIGVLDRR